MEPERGGGDSGMFADGKDLTVSEKMPTVGTKADGIKVNGPKLEVKEKGGGEKNSGVTTEKLNFFKIQALLYQRLNNRMLKNEC